MRGVLKAKPGMALAVEEDEAAGGFGFCGEQGDRLLRGFRGVRVGADAAGRRRIWT